MMDISNWGIFKTPTDTALFVIFSIIFGFVFYGIFLMIMNDRAYSVLNRYKYRYRKALAIKGLSISEDPSGWDESPCEATFTITGFEIKLANMRSYKTLRLVRKIMRDKISIKELQSMSDTPFSKLPE